MTRARKRKLRSIASRPPRLTDEQRAARRLDSMRLANLRRTAKRATYAKPTKPNRQRRRGERRPVAECRAWRELMRSVDVIGGKPYLNARYYRHAIAADSQSTAAAS